VRRLDQLRDPPGNQLKELGGDLAGRWSIRVNQLWRVVFRWDEEAGETEPRDVWLTDYHQ
jgi:toxin HigB-1